MYQAMGDQEKTVSALRKIVDLDPSDRTSRNQLAVSLEQMGKLKSAIKEYEAILAGVAEGEKLILYKHLGYLYTETGQPEKAISSYREAVKRDQTDQSIFYNLSHLYENIDKREKADLYLQEALNLNPDDLEGRFKLAQRLIKKGEMEEAEKYLSEVIQRNPSAVEPILLMVKVAEKKGDTAGLRDLYKKALLLEPENETVLYNLAGLEYEAGHFEASLPYFDQYVKRHPRDAEVHGILFDIYKRLGRASPAFREAETLIELNPKAIEPYHYIFNYLSAQGAYERIIPAMQKGLTANPNQTEIREYLILCYLKLGKEDLAAEQMKEILRTRPKDIELLMALAKLQESLGNIPEALEAYGRVIDLSPGHERAEEAYLRLRLNHVGSEDKE
jgi:tetratricopeptide (TPR) repeat protein